jgi:hypothetical protein
LPSRSSKSYVYAIPLQHVLPALPCLANTPTEPAGHEHPMPDLQGHVPVHHQGPRVCRPLEFFLFCPP